MGPTNTQAPKFQAGITFSLHGGPLIHLQRSAVFMFMTECFILLSFFCFQAFDMRRLLGDSESEYELPDEDTSLLDPIAPTEKHELPPYLHLKLFLIIFLINIAFQILGPAQIQIYQNIICDQYYDKHDRGKYPPGEPIPGDACRISPVQQEIATIRGLTEFFDALPSLVTAIPIGMMADAIGRRPFFRLELSIVVIQQVWITVVTLLPNVIPLRFVWAGYVLNLLSGGMLVAEMLFTCLLADITPEDQLSTVLFRFAAIFQVTRILGPSIAGSLMHISPWVAVYTGLVALVIMTAITWTVPETLHKKSAGFRADVDDYDDETLRLRVHRLLIAAKRYLIDLAKLVNTGPLLMLIVVLSPYRVIANALGAILQQYASNKFDISLANAAYLYSVQAVSATIILFLVLPSFTIYMTKKWHFDSLQNNILQMRGSLLILAVAYMFEGLAPSLPVLLFALVLETAGTGFQSNLKAIISSLVADNDKGRVFSVLAISETLSVLMAFPTITGLFNAGLHRAGDHTQGGATWLGLPFFFSAAIAVVGCVAASWIKFERSTRPLEV
jgi:hypothetical protein